MRQSQAGASLGRSSRVAVGNVENKVTKQATAKATRKVSAFTAGRMVILQRTAPRKVTTKKP